MVSGPLKEMRLGSNDSMRKTLALTLTLSPWRERPELLSRLAHLKPAASGARDVPARSGSECKRRPGEGSGTSRLSKPLRPGTGRAPNEGSWKGDSHSPRRERLPESESCRSPRPLLPLPGAADAVSAKDKNLLGRGDGERLTPLDTYGLAMPGFRGRGMAARPKLTSTSLSKPE